MALEVCPEVYMILLVDAGEAGGERFEDVLLVFLDHDFCDGSAFKEKTSNVIE